MRGVACPITVLIVTPMLDIGAADSGAVELTRILTSAGHRVIVISRAGRLVAEIVGAGGEFIALDVGIFPVCLWVKIIIVHVILENCGTWF